MALQILYVDDSATMQRVMQIAFAREDAQVIAAGTGKAALTASQSARFDVAIVDVGLPDMDGYQVCQALKAETNTPSAVLLLGSKHAPVDEARAQRCGANGHGLKPFEVQSFVDRVRAMCTGSQAPAPAWSDQPRRQPTGGGANPSPLLHSEPTQPSGRSPLAAAAVATPPTAPARPSPVFAPIGEPAPKRAEAVGAAWVAKAPVMPSIPAPAVEPRVAPAAVPRVVRGPPSPARKGAAATSGLRQELSALASGAAGMSDAALFAMAREILERVAWEVVPELAEHVIKEQLARTGKV